MTTAAIYDIHGNIGALEAVVAEIESLGVDEIIVGGDVLPGPLPGECLDLLRGLKTPVSCIHGNGEHAVLDVRRGLEPTSIPKQAWPLIEWTAAQINDEHEGWITSWPMTLARNIAGTSTMFCHATPRTDNEIFTRETEEGKLEPVFAIADESVIVCWHTHMQFDRRAGSKRVINAGSVGMPFGEAGAYWLLIDDDFHLRRTAYDMTAAAGRVRRTSYPQAEEFAANHILTRPDEATILARYKNAELT